VGKGESHMWPSIATAVVTIAVLVIVVAVRSKSGGHIQVKLPDAIIAAIAAALTMFLIDPTQFAEIGIGAGGVTVKRVIVAAVQQKVAKQVTPLPVPPLAEAEKGSLGAIPDLVQHQERRSSSSLNAASTMDPPSSSTCKHSPNTHSSVSWCSITPTTHSSG
jgi:hypothetical protein